MPFNWQEYLDLASFLNDNSERGGFSKEAALRSAVSRAYFAAYCHARKYAILYLKHIPSSFSEENEHKSVRECFKRNSRAKIAIPLDKLRQFRNDCDYDDEVLGLPQIPQNAINLAKGIIKDLPIKSS